MPLTRGAVILNKDKFVQILEEISNLSDLLLLKNKIIILKEILTGRKKDQIGILNINVNGDTVSLRKDVVISELNQIVKSQTKERAIYYLKRLIAGIREVKTSKINDINLSRWKEYDNIITDSLWIFDKRDTSGAHLGWYWGNFIPQIPRQMMLRYTKKGEWVLDTFCGSGTTLIECRRLGRNGVGIELNPEVVSKAKELIQKEPNKDNVVSDIIVGDSRNINIGKILERYKIKEVQLLIMLCIHLIMI
ncbi:MAG: DNA methyltransferase [candidate division WOR-3 bacterium]